MVKKIPWSQRVTRKEKEYLDTVFDSYQKEKGLVSKGDALVHFVQNRTRAIPEGSDPVIPEIIYPDEKEFEATCPFGFLKLISDAHGRSESWHCLKQQGLYSKGKPDLLSNGKDKRSIRAICEACQINYQRGPKNVEKIRIAFQEMGEQKLSSTLYFCVRDAFGDGIKFTPTKHGSFYCVDRRRKVIVESTCIKRKCPFLNTETVSFEIAETIPFSETSKLLEALK